jgi:hypothetical protein
MKVSPPNCAGRCQDQGASATLIVLILLVIMLIFAAGNTRVLYQAKQELRHLEKVQVQKYQLPVSEKSSP